MFDNFRYDRRYEVLCIYVHITHIFIHTYGQHLILSHISHKARNITYYVTHTYIHYSICSTIGPSFYDVWCMRYYKL